MATIPSRPPRTKTIDARAVSFALGGKEKDYPVYQFSGKVKVEKPKHNPFQGL